MVISVERKLKKKQINKCTTHYITCVKMILFLVMCISLSLSVCVCVSMGVVVCMCLCCGTIDNLKHIFAAVRSCTVRE